MKSVPHLAAEKVRQFGREVKRLKVVGGIVEHLNLKGEAYLFGGGARDACFGRGRVVNDLDVVVSGKVDFDQACFSGLNVRKTNFGGYRLHAGEYEMDIWQLNESYAFVRDPTLDIGIGSLLNTVCFTTDSIAMSLDSGMVFVSKAFARALARKSIGFLSPPELLDPLVAARALRLILKLDLAPEESLALYLLKCVEIFGVSNVIEQEDKWHGPHYLNRMSLDAVLHQSDRALKSSVGMND